MNFNYIDSKGFLKIIIFNGLFLRFFFNFNLLYQFILFYNFYYRISKSSQKNRSFCNFSKRKLYRQKGTGMSRAGPISSSTRIGGGVAFPNFFYINYRLNFNKKTYKFSFFLIYNNLFFNNFFFILEDLFFLEIKTKIILNYFNFYNNYFILTLNINKNFFFSILNSRNFKLFYFFSFNPLCLLKYSKILLTRSFFNYFLNVY